jgi:hypothetical protein
VIGRCQTGATTKKSAGATNRADPKLPLLSEQQQNVTLTKLEESIGKVITWNPNDKAPIFSPQETQVQHPFMVNTTVTPDAETKSGTFNQTLEY